MQSGKNKSVIYYEMDYNEFSGPRDYDEQTDAFRFELDSMVDRYLQEFDINTITMIGALREKMQELINAGNMGFEPDDDFFDEL